MSLALTPVTIPLFAADTTAAGAVSPIAVPAPPWTVNSAIASTIVA